MSIEFTCTKCGRSLQAGDATAGTRILCPACGAFSTVPAPSAGQSPVPPNEQEAGAPIEFRCTGCSKLLRTAAHTAGKHAKCPECGTIVPVPEPGTRPLEETLPHPGRAAPPSEEVGTPFAPGGETAAAGDPENPYAAPTQYGQPPSRPFAASDAMAANRVAGPAIALIVTGALGVAAQLLALAVNLIQMGGGLPAGGQGPMPMAVPAGVNVASAMIGMILYIVVIMGAVKMKNLESYGFAMAASIIAMLPCSCCCLLGLPFGIWSLVVLSDAGVKAAFRG
ncbi:MAG: Yip1 family protein [Planctomycetota bacterium]|jgi:phage FluMu protein Com